MSVLPNRKKRNKNKKRLHLNSLTNMISNSIVQCSIIYNLGKSIFQYCSANSLKIILKPILLYLTELA